MKYIYPVIVACLLLTGIEVKAEDGKGVFGSLHCGICHKIDTGKTSPSMKEIARVYMEKEDQLLNYLNGHAEALIRPEKAGRMKRYIEKTKALSEGDRKSLVDFILSHRD